MAKASSPYAFPKGPLSLSAYARHRARLGLPGATKQAVAAAIKRGRISVDANGKIPDAKAADLQWAKSTSRKGGDRGSPGAPQGGIRSDYPGRLQNEMAAVLNDRLDCLASENELVDRLDAERILNEQANKARETWLAFPKTRSRAIAKKVGCQAAALHRLLEAEVARVIDGNCEAETIIKPDDDFIDIAEDEE